MAAGGSARSPREIAAFVPMPGLLAALGFTVNERTRRAPCLVHGGQNESAFAWTDGGLWKCHSCGAGGDRIGLVRAVRKCAFREAVEFLAALAGVKWRPGKVSRRDIEARQALRTRTETSAWAIRDEIGRLRRYYRDGLHRAEALWRRLGEELLRAGSENEREAAWERLARLAPAQTLFLAGFNFLCDAQPGELARLALATPAERRKLILEGSHVSAWR